MAKKILCPYCFKDFNNNEVMMQCENMSTVSGQELCPKEENSKFSQFWGTNVQTKHIFPPKTGFMSALMGYNPKAEKCDKCGSFSKKFVCPHCNNWLPTEMIEKGSEIISVIGGPASGKTNYIVTLMQQIKKYGYKINLQITPQQVGRNKAEYTYNKYKEAENMLFEEHFAVEKTKETSHPIPWIFRLESYKTKKAVYLVFYDTAGESFRDVEEMRRNAKYLSESTAVIVLFDTLSIKKIKKILENKDIENQDKATPFDETWTALENFAIDNKTLYKKPFAFVFSKFDVIIDNKLDINCDVNSFLSNSSFIKSGVYSLKEVEEAHNSIKNYLEEPDIWDEGQMATDINERWKQNYKFFGVSAFGSMADSSKYIEEVRPYRVMDPLIWLLTRLGGFGIPTDES